MAIEDEKTRPALKAVKRKDVTEVTTRRVKAVKRSGTAEARFSRFLVERRVSVLRRGGLLNAAEKKDNGWVLREMLDKIDTAWFVMRNEPLLTTISRLLVEQGYDLDVMSGRTCVAGLRLQRVTSPSSGRAQLVGPDGELLAVLLVKGQHHVECLDGAGRPLVKLEVVHASQCNLLAGDRSIGTLVRVAEPGLLLTTYELDLSLSESATGFQRLCAAAAVVTGEAWHLASKHLRGKDATGDLLSLFDD